MSSDLSRREFLRKTTTAAAGVSMGLGVIGSPSGKSVLGANDRIRMGFIGVGNRGTKLLKSFMSYPQVEVAGICDLYEPYRLRDNSAVAQILVDEVGGRVPPMNEGVSKKVPRYQDFRNLLDQQDIDAVCIATPDHWHALQTLMALDAGKDVYVEKPLTVTVEEGRKMVEAEQASDRIVQVGLNRRGAPIYQKLVRMVQDGANGKVTLARAYRISNMYPDGIGQRRPSEPPHGFNWDMWLGPRAFRPYQSNIFPYKFRWWADYSSQMGTWGVHYMDAIRWMLGEQAPVAVTAHGGKFALQDDRTIPDTMEVTFEFASGALVLFGNYEASGGDPLPYGEIELQGTKANLYSEVQPVEEEYEPPARDDMRYTPTAATAALIENFLNCVQSRKKEDLLCPLEEGHRSTTFALLANIALETGTRLEWDADRELITNHKFANQYLHYEYRDPWDEVWKSLV
ncbi:MAG: Gfo/Idh/MocA family oxidoreductase [Calditrichota bacterium]